MTIQGEFAIAEQWMTETLSADATITAYVGTKIFPEEAEEGTAAPWIVFRNKTAPDVMMVNQDRLWTTMLYHVDLVVVGNDIFTPDPVFVRIDQLLHKGGGTTPGGQVLACTRQGLMNTPSLDAGIEYRHLTGIYELLVQQN